MRPRRQSRALLAAVGAAALALCTAAIAAAGPDDGSPLPGCELVGDSAVVDGQPEYCGTLSPGQLGNQSGEYGEIMDIPVGVPSF